MLDGVLQKLWKYVGPKKTIEVRINRPKEVIVETRDKGKEFIKDPDMSIAYLKDVMAGLAINSGIPFDDENPIVSTSLPGNHRFQGLCGPSVPDGISITIRCKHPFKATYDSFGLKDEPLEMLIAAVKAERSVIISGSTNSGKTTLLNRLLEEIEPSRRMVAIEDTQELAIDRFKDRVAILVGRDENSKAPGMIDNRQAYDHLMRSTPEIAVFSEISTSNAFAALSLLNSGHRGFMCTIHSDSPDQVVNRKFSQNVEWAGDRMSNIPEYLRDLVDLVVQVHKTTDGRREVESLFLPKYEEYVYQTKSDTLLDFKKAMEAVRGASK